ncbi:MAG: conserved exported protein of unknown function [Candidatus Thorarchaeota archaeon]|nr:MAG: conserved exported protein of unknown function [Candidatus Thorarchaeota archaeon]
MITSNSRILSLFAIVLFLVSLTYVPMGTNTSVADTSLESFAESRISSPSALPTNYTYVNWDQGTISEEWQESFQHSHWQFGPKITWSVRNASSNSLISLTDELEVDGWANFQLKLPMNALQGKVPHSIALMGMYWNVSEQMQEGPISQNGIVFLGIYEIPTDTWVIYSSQNATMEGGTGGDDGGGGGEPKPPTGTDSVTSSPIAQLAEAKLAPEPGSLEEFVWMAFGEPVDSFVELDADNSSYQVGPENYWTTFKLKFNTTTPIGVYQISAVALDENLGTLAESEHDELSARAVGMSFDEVIQQGAGGYYYWDRYDDDGNPVYSATRGVDFNMTAKIKSDNPGAVIVYIELPQSVEDEEWVYGPYTETQEVTGGWEYNSTTDTYYWNDTVSVTTTVYKNGFHWETRTKWIDPGKEYRQVHYEWSGSDWFIQHEWTSFAWARQALIFNFSDGTWSSKYSYTIDNETLVVDPNDPSGYSPQWYQETIYEPWPTNSEAPKPYILNTTTSENYTLGGYDYVTFRGHISEEILPTGDNSNPLWVEEKVLSTDGKRLAPFVYLPTASSTDESSYQALRQLSVESPIAVVRLTHDGQPYDPSWMFAVDHGDAFEVKSRLQGGAEYASDIDGVAFVLRAWDHKWGSNGTSDWSQYSEVEIYVKGSPEGNFQVKAYNFTERTSYEYSSYWDWQEIEIVPGVWEWQLVEITGWHWEHKIWNFTANDWTTKWVPRKSNATVMPGTFLIAENLTYTTIGNDLRIIFDIEVQSDMPDMEWEWDYFYGNLSLVTDYESEWGEHTLVGWVTDSVYSYENGTDRYFVDTPNQEPVMRNNVTDELYEVRKDHWIHIDGQKHYVRTLTQTDQSGYTWDTVIYEEWDDDGYDPSTGSYTGNWIYYYRLLNGTKIYIESGYQSRIFNTTFSDGTWFLSSMNASDWRFYADWKLSEQEYIYALNGTKIFADWSTWATATIVNMNDTTPVQEGNLVVYANGTIPINVATEPFWQFDHYVLYVNQTWEELKVYDMYCPLTDNWEYYYYNGSDLNWLFRGPWPHRMYQGSWNGYDITLPKDAVDFYAYTEIGSNHQQLPYPGAEVWDFWDLKYKTPADTRVYIEEQWVEAIKEEVKYTDALYGYEYSGFIATVGATDYNLTWYGTNENYRWDPIESEYPWVTTNRDGMFIPDIRHHDWTVAYGTTNPQTREFEVQGWLDLVSGYLNNQNDAAIYNWNNTAAPAYQYVETIDGTYLNYTTLQRGYFYNITLENGTSIYTGDPYVADKAVEKYDIEADRYYYEPEFWYVYDLNGTMHKWYDWQKFTIEVMEPDDYDNATNIGQFLFNSYWYNYTNYTVDYWNIDIQNWTSNSDYWNLEIEDYVALVNSTDTFEIVSLSEGGRNYNLPSFNFSHNAQEYVIKGSRDMIYKAYKVWGHSKKLDYVPLPISIVREQWSFVTGSPEFGMWGVDTWTTNPNNGAIDLDGNLDTTDDQFFVRNTWNSTETYNITQEYLKVDITWDPNSTLIGDEVYMSSYTGMYTVNWTGYWWDNFTWYEVETGEVVNSSRFDLINTTVFNSEGHPNAGYWGVAWMAENFTSADLKQQAIEEGWAWAVEDSREWSWLWWEISEDYQTEYVNGSDTVYADVSIWYEYAGMFAWNDTDDSTIMELNTASMDDSEITHYWMPVDVESVSFVRPGEAWGNSSDTGEAYRAVDETITFGVTFNNVSGIVFPFGEYSYWDWYQGQYYGTDLNSFDSRPSGASVDQIGITVNFSGEITGQSTNNAEIKYDMTVGNWDVDAPGGRSVLDGYSLGLAFYSDVSIVLGDTPYNATYHDDFDSQLENTGTSASSNFTAKLFGSVPIAAMNLGGSPYTWAKNASFNATVDSQTVPLSAFEATYMSDVGGTATTFSVSSNQFYTLINFKWWDGYKVTVDPVFVGYSSSGTSDATSPTVDSITESGTVNNLHLDIEVSDVGSGVSDVLVMNTDTNANVSATFNTASNRWEADISRSQAGQYDYNYVVVAIDGADNEGVSSQQSYTFPDNIDPQITNQSVRNGTDSEGKEIAIVSADVTDTGGSGLSEVILTYSDSQSVEHNVTMTVTSGDTYEGTIPNQPEDSYVSFHVLAIDGAGNGVESDSDTFHFYASGPDVSGPSVLDVSIEPSTPRPDDVVTVSATILDSTGVDDVILQYRIGSGDWINVTMTGSGDVYSGDIPAQAVGTTVTYRIVAYDTLGNENVCNTHSYTVQEEPTDTTTTTTGPGPSTPIDVGTLMMVAAGVAGVVVILLIVVLIKRRG